MKTTGFLRIDDKSSDFEITCLKDQASTCLAIVSKYTQLEKREKENKNQVSGRSIRSALNSGEGPE